MHNFINNKSVSVLLGTAIIALGFGASQAAMAATATSSMGVNATVTSNCVLSTSAVSFGDVDVTSGSDVDGTGGISVTCTSGTAWTASADAGTGTGASLATRKMANGANLLNYVLYTDTSRTSVWGDGVEGATATIGDTGSGSAQAKTIYARVPSGQTSLPAGSYADTVTVTVTY